MTARLPIAAGVGAVVAALVIAGDATGLLAGPLAMLGTVIAWIFVPTSRSFVQRLAINGALVLGFAPILLWAPALRLGRVGVVGILLALAIGFLAAMFAFGPSSRRRLLPRFGSLWWIPAGTALFSLWYFRPLLVTRSKSASLNLLIQAFGGDNVAHFDMFAMIRTHSAANFGWGAAADGSTYAYDNYPQHFHSLVAMAAELWAGPAVEGENLAGLFAFGTAAVLAAALITLTAAIAASESLARIPGLPAIAAVTAVSVLFLGAGVSNLRFGFPGFALGIIGALIAIVLATSRRRPGLGELAAVGGLLVLVAHCWILLAPLAGIPFVVLVWRTPWRVLARGGKAIVASVIVCVVVAAGTVYAAALVLWATSSAGTPQEALSTPGGVAPLPIPAAFSLVFAILAICAAGLGRSGHGRPIRQTLKRSQFVLLAVVAGLGLLEGIALLAMQLIHVHMISYFQFKFFNGLILAFAVVLALAASLLIAELIPHGVPKGRRAITLVAVGLTCVALVALSGLPTAGKVSLAGQAFPSDAFRNGLNASAATPSAAIGRIAAAASVMQSHPCEVPFYLPADADDMNPGVSDQWAMAISNIWTARGSMVMNYYFAHSGKYSPENAFEHLAVLLGQDPSRCAVVAPAVREKMDADILQRYGSRILSWNP